jgi:hypothetical protein
MKKIIPALPNTVIKWHGDSKPPSEPDQESVVIAWLFDNDQDHDLVEELDYTIRPITSSDVTYWMTALSNYYGDGARLVIDGKVCQ